MRKFVGDEAKVARVIEVMEHNINVDDQTDEWKRFTKRQTDLASHLSKEMVTLLAGWSGIKPPLGKLDRALEERLRAELTPAEEEEVSRRRKIKARECWENGENYKKFLWGGW
jgi:hypothetical protein